VQKRAIGIRTHDVQLGKPTDYTSNPLPNQALALPSSSACTGTGETSNAKAGAGSVDADFGDALKMIASLPLSKEATVAHMLAQLEVPEHKWAPATLARYKRGDFGQAPSYGDNGAAR
jgi:hypothetical protein